MISFIGAKIQVSRIGLPGVGPCSDRYIIVILQRLMAKQATQPGAKEISLMIIGAQKAGTTSLKNYLGQHPSLRTHPHKELSFFFDATEFGDGFETAFRKYYSPGDEEQLLIGKSAGLYMTESGLERLRQHNPACKLVFILRNPVERTYSSYLMEKNYGHIHEPFESILPVMKKADPDDWRYACFVGMSLYAAALQTILRYFNRDQLLILRYEELSRDPQNCCRKVFEMLGVDHSFKPDTSQRHNETRVNTSSLYGKVISKLLRNTNPIKKMTRMVLPGKMDYKVGEALRGINRSSRKYPPMSPEMSCKLRDFYLEPNEKLSELTGMDFSEWNKLPEHN